MTQSDVDAGSFTNTASVDAEDPDGDPVADTDDETVPAANTPSIVLTKTADQANYDSAGDVLTYTLTVLGYLRQTPKYGKYQLGSALVSTAYPLLASIGLRQLARPQMNALADETGGSVSMGVRDRLNIVLIETSRSRGRVRTPVGGSRADTGLTVPIGGSAIGRAYLAGCDLESRDALQNAIRVKTPDDWRRWSPGNWAAR